MVKKALIIGAGGHCRSVIESLRSVGEEPSAVIDIDYKGQKESIMGVPVTGPLESLYEKHAPGSVALYLAIGFNETRKDLFMKLSGMGYELPSVFHKTSIVAPSASIGAGVFIGAGSIIGALASVADNAIVNTGSIIDHETSVGLHSHIAPGVRIAGRVKIGSGCSIGIGSSVIDKVTIGDNAILGAGSVVISDIGADRTAVGVPAREIK